MGPTSLRGPIWWRNANAIMRSPLRPSVCSAVVYLAVGLCLTGAGASREDTTYRIQFHIKGGMRDELALFEINQAVRKVEAVTGTAGILRRNSVDVEFDPRKGMPLRNIVEAVKRTGHEIDEMVLDCEGTFFVEGYRKEFKTESGQHVFHIAEGGKVEELMRNKPPVKIKIQASVNLRKLESPYVLVLKTFELP